MHVREPWPAGPDGALRVAAAILPDAEGRLLVGRRPAGKACAGQWEFVGGKLEPGETPPDALARELREETGAAVAAEGFERREVHEYPAARVAVDFLWARLLPGSPAPAAREHAELRFVPPADLSRLPFCSADAPVAARLAATGAARPRLVLASASPRRARILADLGAPFLVRPADTEEPRPADPAAAVRAAALAKHAAARAAADPSEAVLAADTLVECEGVSLGKPRDREDAVATLLRLSGREHRVLTAVAVSSSGDAGPDLFLETSRVRFRPLSRADAVAYLDLARTLDRAGAYDIACHGDRLVAGLDGSFSNVMGLPADPVAAWLRAHALLPPS